MLRGYDISNINGGISTPQDAEFVIAKVSQDASFVDTYYARHRNEARQRELGFGGYHYGDPTEQPNPEASVDFFLENLGEQQGGEIAALDVEQDYGDGGFTPHNSINQPWVLAWGRRFVKLKNYKPKLYTSNAGILDFDLDTPEMADLYDLWYAWWPDDPSNLEPPPAPSPWKTYKLWQHNADNIDKDLFLGTLEEFKASGQQPKESSISLYEAKYWTPMQNLLNNLVAGSHFPHADAAFHAAVSNIITIHKIAVGAEKPT